MSNIHLSNETPPTTSTNLSRHGDTPSGAITPSTINSSEITPQNSSSHYTSDNNESNYIVSVIWERGFLSAAYYNVSSMKLFVSPEVFDAKPNYQFLHMLFNQLNITEVIVSGTGNFIKAVMKLCELPYTDDLDQYRVKRYNAKTSQSFVIYKNSEKTLESHRKRIFNLNLPESSSATLMQNDKCSKEQQEHERKMFIETKIPIHQELVVQALGNLLIYLDANWCHLFLTNDPNPIITDYQVIMLNKQMYIDEFTMLALQIFSPTERHPSGFKRGTEQEVKEGLSVFDIFDNCTTKIGRFEMKMLFQQPSCDIDTLTERYNMIDWCLKKSNQNRIKTFKIHLKNMVNIYEVYLRLTAKGFSTTVTDWHTFYQCIMSIYQLYKLCNDIIDNQGKSAMSSADIIDDNDFIFKLAMVHIIDGDDDDDDDDDDDISVSDMDTDAKAIQNAVTILTRTFDIEKSKKQKRFVVKYEFDNNLDESKVKLKQLHDEMEVIVNEKIEQLPTALANLSLEYVNDFGFILGFQNDKNFEHNSVISKFKEFQFEYLYSDKKKMFFKSLTLIDQNNAYTKLKTSIRYSEQLIAEAILEYLQPHISRFQTYICLCAKLDCFITMAATANQYNLIRPNITTEKGIDIKNGRHILLEKLNRADVITNDTLINCDVKNLITILTAPNAAGKTVYLKQIGLILFMAHIGSFVPAESATIGLIDGIYTRMNAVETIRHNTSSFLNEIQQLSKMLTYSTTNSFLIIDEFGQGTTSAEGKAFLCSTIETLMKRQDKAPITMISTHSIDIVDYVKINEWVCMKTIAIKRNADNMIRSTYKIIDGRCTKEYAMECAELKAAFQLIFNDENFDSDDEPINPAESTTTDDGIEERKIQIAFDIFKLYVHNGFVDDEVIDQMLDEAII